MRRIAENHGTGWVTATCSAFAMNVAPLQNISTAPTAGAFTVQARDYNKPVRTLFTSTFSSGTFASRTNYGSKFGRRGNRSMVRGRPLFDPCAGQIISGSSDGPQPDPKNEKREIRASSYVWVSGSRWRHGFSGGDYERSNHSFPTKKTYRAGETVEAADRRRSGSAPGLRICGRYGSSSA